MPLTLYVISLSQDTEISHAISVRCDIISYENPNYLLYPEWEGGEGDLGYLHFSSLERILNIYI